MITLADAVVRKSCAMAGAALVRSTPGVVRHIRNRLKYSAAKVGHKVCGFSYESVATPHIQSQDSIYYLADHEDQLFNRFGSM